MKLLQRIDGRYHVITVQHHLLNIDKNGVLTTISTDPARLAPCSTTFVDVGEEQNHIKVKRAIVHYGHQAPEGEDSESDRCEKKDTETHPTPEGSETIDTHDPREYKDADLKHNGFDR